MPAISSLRVALVALTALTLAACDVTGPVEQLEPVTVVSVTPAAGEAGVAAMSPVVVRFSAAMAAGAEAHMDVHRGGASGETVAGSWAWSHDRHTATFTPSFGYAPGELHTLHLGGGVAANGGQPVDFQHCLGMGGAWVGGEGSGMHGGDWQGHHGQGWMHENGSYGMGFGFTTGGTAPSDSGAVTIVSVSPAPGASGVDATTTIAIEFSAPMPDSATLYMDLHASGYGGATVAGEWSWDEDRRIATFTPTEALQPATQYVVHVGGGLVDGTGEPVDYQHCLGTGGSWAGGGQTGGHHSGGGHHSASQHSGDGWQHQNGTYGVMFSFTTA